MSYSQTRAVEAIIKTVLVKKFLKKWKEGDVSFQPSRPIPVPPVLPKICHGETLLPADDSISDLTEKVKFILSDLLRPPLCPTLLPPSLFCVWKSTKDPNRHIQVLSFHLGPLAPDAEWPPSSWYSTPGIIWFVLFWFFSPCSCPFCLLFPLPFLNVGIPQGSLLDALSLANSTFQSLVSSSNSNLPLLAPLHPSLTPEL